MLPLEVRKCLFDAAQPCALLAQFTSGKTFADYAADPLLRSAVERQIEIVGEAINQALRTDSGLSDRISGSRRIIAFRNRLIHGYASESDEMVWGVLETSLPALRREMQALLDEPEGNPEPRS